MEQNTLPGNFSENFVKKITNRLILILVFFLIAVLIVIVYVFFQNQQLQINNEVLQVEISPLQQINSVDINDPLYIPKSIYDVYLTKKADVVMLGDSITYNVDWNELFGNKYSIINRGIPGDSTEKMLNRMYYIYKLDPEICFIMAGVNDFLEEKKPEEVFENYKKIIIQLKEHDIMPIVQSTLYLLPLHEDFINKNIIYFASSICSTIHYASSRKRN